MCWFWVVTFHLLGRNEHSSTVGDKLVWNCQDKELTPESADWLRSSSAISFSNCTKPGGSTPYLFAKRATSNRHRITFLGWLCRTETSNQVVRSTDEDSNRILYPSRRFQITDSREHPMTDRTLWSFPCCLSKRSFVSLLSRSIFLVWSEETENTYWCYS